MHEQIDLVQLWTIYCTTRNHSDLLITIILRGLTIIQRIRKTFREKVCTFSIYSEYNKADAIPFILFLRAFFSFFGALNELLYYFSECWILVCERHGDDSQAVPGVGPAVLQRHTHAFRMYSVSAAWESVAAVCNCSFGTWTEYKATLWSNCNPQQFGVHRWRQVHTPGRLRRRSLHPVDERILSLHSKNSLNPAIPEDVQWNK